VKKAKGKRQKAKVGEPNMITRILTWLLASVLLAHVAEAQPAGTISRLGFFGAGSASSAKGVIEAFSQGLRELGYVEGQNVVIEYRYAQGKAERLADLATELVRLRPDVIVTVGTVATLAVKQVTGTIPIVVAGAGDLVGAGLVATLSRPGGNVTGSTNIDPDLSAKRLELLKESLPSLARVAVLLRGGPAGAGGDYEELKETQAAARTLKIQVQPLEVKDPAQFSERYGTMKKERAGALIIFHGAFTAVHRPQLVELAAKNRLPTMCGEPTWSDAGCLISYGHDRSHQARRAAVFVDKILKGTKPADIPVEQPTKFELIINLKTAKQIGVTIPQSVLYRADKVIK
jgi:putative ABC transport system substrate-binding protein